ncbi:MAG: cell division protein SepF [Thermococcus sp.]|uniref:cell division protein SepF n=1 Tax=Thermococcus sp. TaxID=35749 RepID=UPI0026025383|nr:cell division protein SepF [Thermococcus sp.]MCD6140001.1 cell division protein SepF [Thermococcus sp.]MCD6144653.1 cell division protein SepF [Thermococcus sp.]
MGLFDKLTKKEEPKKELGAGRKRDIKREVDVIPMEEDLLAKTITEPEVRYIKKIVVTSYSDLEKISEEVQAGNIIIADLTPLESKPEVLAKVVEQIKGITQALGGETAKIAKHEIKILITPSDIKIYRG